MAVHYTEALMPGDSDHLYAHDYDGEERRQAVAGASEGGRAGGAAARGMRSPESSEVPAPEASPATGGIEAGILRAACAS